jgi:hypothetical protein
MPSLGSWIGSRLGFPQPAIAHHFPRRPTHRGYRDGLVLGQNVLARFLEVEARTQADPVAVELGFGVGVELAGEEGGFRFVDRVDRVDRAPNGSTQIVDYRTGRSRSQADVDADPQLTAYAFGCARGGLRDPATGVTLALASRLGSTSPSPVSSSGRPARTSSSPTSRAASSRPSGGSATASSQPGQPRGAAAGASTGASAQRRAPRRDSGSRIHSPTEVYVDQWRSSARGFRGPSPGPSSDSLVVMASSPIAPGRSAAREVTAPRSTTRIAYSVPPLRVAA